MPADFVTTTAKSAESFNSSVGIVVHWPSSSGTLYANYDAWFPKLIEGGFGHVRTGWAMNHPEADSFITSLAKSGIEVMMQSDWIFSNKIPVKSVVDYIAARPELAKAITEIEGPNEVNANFSNWQATVPAFMKELYTAFKANPATAHIQVVAPNFDEMRNDDIPPQMGDISKYVDVGDIHGSNGGEAPTDAYFQDVIDNARVLVGPTKPLVNSEGGYSYGTDSSALGHPIALPRDVIEYDVMHYYLDNYAHGILHSDLYQLVNDHAGTRPWGDSFGILNNDYTGTNVYDAIRSMTSLLKDPGYSASFTPDTLTYKLEGTDADTRTLLLEKSEGTFWLAVWQQEQTFNYNVADSQKGPVAQNPMAMKLTLQGAADGAVYVPENGNTNTVSTFDDASTISFTGGKEVVLIEIDPQAATTPTPAPTPTPQPAGHDTLVLHVAEDAYKGDAKFQVLVDGKQIGDLRTATTLHSSGDWQDVTITGDFDKGVHKVDVVFVNDAWGGSPTTDRNLHVNGLEYDGQHYDAAAALTKNGSTLTVNVTDDTALSTTPTPTPTPTPSAPDKLLFRVSEDAYLGDAQFKVTVDGKQVGTAQTIHAPHAADAWEDIILTGDFGSAAHQVSISYVNNAFGGSAAKDRNMYLDHIEINGHRIEGEAATSNTAANGHQDYDPHAAVMTQNGTVTFSTPADYWV